MTKTIAPEEKAKAAQPIVLKIEEIESKQKNLKIEMSNLLKERRALRAELKPFIWDDGCDLGCDCDDNHCVSPDFSNQPLASGQTKTFIHDDQDTSDYTVVCNVGKIEAILSVAPWSTWHEVARKTLSAGESWSGTQGQYDPGYDQTVKLQVTAISDSYVSMKLESWDV